MYDFIRGRLVHSSTESAVVDVGGVGYRLHIPATLYARLPDAGSELTFYTSFVIRENLQALYGFLDARERQFFEVLLGVSGVGPKMALAIVGHLGLDGLHAAVSDQDIKAVCRVPGVGKKTAERLLLEMRDKLGKHFMDYTVSAPIAGGGSDHVLRDAMSALVNLGYNQMAARKALQKLLKEGEDPPELGKLITLALQHI
ncbi:MAG: Holliday junction branch migration protein RuvA [Chlamydiia bacterium]|nr:Holliday junction branch migration protein RuvA [Chlamydiia bacterium]